jgi:hypothetical protein
MRKRQRRRQDKRRRHVSGVPTKRQLTAVGGVALGASLITGTGAQAATFDVTNLNDIGAGSLRAALASNDANNNSPTVDNVVFDSGLSGTIDSYGVLTTSEPVNIQGPGAGQVAVNEIAAPCDCPVFYFDMDNAYDPVIISGLTLTGGDVDGTSYDNGGGVSSLDADLTLQDMVVDDNYAPSAGGVFNFFGPTAINSSTVSNNDATDTGGGVASFSGNMTISSSTITGNSAEDVGGGIFQFLGGLDVNSSSVSGNGGYSTGAGGGLYSRKYQPTIQNSTFSGNIASVGAGLFFKYSGASIQGSTVNDNYAQLGGGFFSYKPYYPTTFSNSTVAANRAIGAGAGGALRTYGHPFTFSDTTIAANRTTGGSTTGGGVAVAGSASPDPTLANAIVSGNTASNGPDLYGPFDAAFSLVQNTSGATVNSTVAGSNLLGVDPLLGGLANNGGPTQTMALSASSPAVDKGSSSAGSDQRGSPRPFDFAAIANSAAGGNGADMGAFELGGTNPRCKGKEATIARTAARTFKGTSKRDVIVGTSKKDKINSGGGKDLVCAKGGNDKVNGGAGKDKLYGQGGKDKLLGKGGNDKLVGGAKKDRLVGGPGKDKLLGKGGNDTCVGGPGRDVEKSC